DKTSGSPSSLRNRPRPKHHIPGLRPLSRSANIDGSSEPPAATTARALGQGRHPLESPSQLANMQSNSPTTSEGDSTGVKKSESRTTLKTLKQEQKGRYGNEDAGDRAEGRKPGYFSLFARAGFYRGS